MICAKVCSDGERYRLEMQGHAGYNPGNDVVCAGASAIAYALLGYLHNAGEHLVSVEEERVESGDIRLCCRGDEMVGEAFKMALVGLLQIEEAYPENVVVKGEFEGL